MMKMDILKTKEGDIMTEQDVMTDKMVLETIWDNKPVDHQTLDALLYRLCHAGDNPDSDTLQRYTHITWNVFDDKICDILSYIVTDDRGWYAIYNCKKITDDDIRNQVGVLPTFSLIDFIEGAESNYFLVVDYEAPDKVYKCDYLVDILMDTVLHDVIYNLNENEIKNIINYINDLDLFDIELYKEYNE